MLPRQHRLSDGAGFDRAVRAGARRGSRLLVVHAASGGGSEGPPVVGFVVSRRVGNAVVRNRVRRRLQHLVADSLPGFPPGATLVVRAQPAAAAATYEDLRGALVRCLDEVLPTAAPGGAR